MRKITLLMMLVVCFAAQANTRKLYCKPEKVNANTNISWTESTQTFGVWGSNNNTYTLFKFDAGTLSKYSTINLNITDKDHTRILFMAGSSSVYEWVFGSTGEKNVSISAIKPETLTEEAIATITEIRFGGRQVSGNSSENPCNITFDPAVCYIETADGEYMNITTTLNSSSTRTTPFVWEKMGEDAYEITKNFGNDVTNGIIFGPSSSKATTASFGIIGYERANITLTKAATNQVRLLYNETAKAISTLEGKTNYVWNNDGLTAIATIKTQNGGTNAINVSSIDLVKEYDVTSTAAFSIAPSAASAISYDRTFTIDRTSTVCLPFSLTAEQVTAAGEFYEFVAFDGANLGFNPVTKTAAYTPYLFVPKAEQPFTNIIAPIADAVATTVEHGGYTFKGVLQHIDDVYDAETGNTVYGYNAANGEFVKVVKVEESDKVSIDAFRAYIVVIPSGASLAPKLKVSLGKQTPTGVEEVSQETIVMSQKLIKNGQLFIIRDGKTYNAMGQLINDK